MNLPYDPYDSPEWDSVTQEDIENHDYRHDPRICDTCRAIDGPEPIERDDDS